MNAKDITRYPERVQPQGDNGRYLVQSKSKPGIQWLVDVTSYECRCPRAIKGKSAQFRIKNGYLPYRLFCDHLKLAIAYDGILLRMMLEEQRLAPATC